MASIVIAYLLEGVVALLERRSLPRLISVVIVFILFLLFVALVLLGLLPLLSRQVTDFVQQLPAMISMGQQALMQLPERYPDLIPQDQMDQLIRQIRMPPGPAGTLHNHPAGQRLQPPVTFKPFVIKHGTSSFLFSAQELYIINVP